MTKKEIEGQQYMDLEPDEESPFLRRLRELNISVEEFDNLWQGGQFSEDDICRRLGIYCDYYPAPEDRNLEYYKTTQEIEELKQVAFDCSEKIKDAEKRLKDSNNTDVKAIDDYEVSRIIKHNTLTKIVRLEALLEKIPKSIKE